MKRTRIVLTALLVLGLVGCKREQPRAAAPRSTEYAPVVGRFGGRLIFAEISPPKSFNPIVAGETTTSVYTGQFFLGLTRTNAWTFAVEPELATGWEHDESGKVWTVKLRQGVEWSDGTPFTADDVLFTYATIYDERITSSMRDIITGPNGEQWQLRKIDDFTVEFTLFDKNAIFPLLLADGIIPRHKYKPLVDSGKFNEALGVNIDPSEIVGAGPYVLGSFDGSKVVLKRNPRYYKRDAAGNRLPYLDELVFLIVPDMDVQLLKLKNREIDFAALRGSDFPVMAPLQGQQNFTIYKLGPADGSTFLTFNQNTGKNPSGEPYVAPHKLKWFRDPRFRRAVSHGVDREAIVNNVMNGLGYPQYGPMNAANENLPFVNPDMPKFPYDLEKARVLLKEMGLVDRDGDGFLEDEQGNRVEFNLTTNVENDVRLKAGEIIRKDLETLGMRVNFRPTPFNQLITQLDYTFDWEAVVMSLTGGPEPAWGGNVWKSSGRLHMWHPRQQTPSTEWEARIDELWAEGMRELDPARRKEIYHEWQDIVGREQPFIYTAAPERLLALRNKFGNIFPSPFGGVLHNIDEVFLLGE